MSSLVHSFNTSTACVQRFHSEEILSEVAEILSGTPKFECGVFARDCRYDKIVIQYMTT